MGRVLQALRHARRLTAAEESESRTVFALAIGGPVPPHNDDGDDLVMTIPQLRLCLRALGFALARGEENELVYEFDFDSSGTLRLADFQKIFLYKTLELSDRQLFHDAFSAVAGGETSVRVCDLDGQGADQPDLINCSKTAIDSDTLARHLQAQYYDDDSSVESEADSIRSTGRVSSATLARFLRVE